MTAIDLCPQEDLYPVFPTRENPAFPTRSGPQDYLDLESIKELVDQTLEFLGKPVPVHIQWSNATSRHGAAKRDFDLPERQLLEARTAALNAAIRARLTTTAVARKELREYMATLPQVFVIKLSKPVFKHATVESRVETIIHEACHIAAPFNAGHGPEWQELMRRCGVSPSRTAAAPEGISLRWTCPKCGRVGSMTPKMAAMIRTGAKAACNSCATTLSSEDLRVPPEMERRVAMAERRLAKKRGILPGLQKECLICGRPAAPGRRTCARPECQSKLVAYYQGEPVAARRSAPGRCPKCGKSSCSHCAGGCGRVAPPGREYCTECERPRCEMCGEPARPGDTFCETCASEVDG